MKTTERTKRTKRVEEEAAEQVVARVAVGELVGSPLNRRFETSGAEWEEFCESIRVAGGVRVPLQCRRVTGEDGVEFGEIMAGHRRHAGAVACGLKTVPVLWLEMDDGEALAFLVNENLQRLNLSPVDEARLVRAMREELEIEDEEIARRISRSVGWVRTRQLLLELGDEVLAAVRSTDADRHLSLASVEEILRVPAELREQAVQLVLHPSFDTKPLRPEEARAFLQDCLVRPHAAERVWEGARAKVAEEWRKRLRKGVGKALADNVTVVSVAYPERERLLKGAVGAEWNVDLMFVAPGAPVPLSYAMLAARHGLAVQIVPGDDGVESKAVVSVGLLRLAEETLAEHGGAAWMRGKKIKTEEEKTEDRRLEKIVSELDGEGGAVPEERPATVIEQGMQHFAMIDMGAVKRVEMWACMPAANPMDAPEWVPQWARRMGVEGMWTEIDEVVNWIAGLKK